MMQTDTSGKLTNQMEDQAVNFDQSNKSKTTLFEERLNIDVRKVESSKVQVHKKVVLEEVSQDVELNQEEISIERKPIDQYVDTAPEIRYEGNVTIIPVIKEVLFVEKRLVLVEEIYITKKQFSTTTTVTEPLRKEEVEIVRIDLHQDSTTSNQ